jgi:CubicO group peptidase (beta-lactamase class C family)
MLAAAALSVAGPTPLMLSLAAPVRALAQPGAGAGAGAKAGEAGADQALLAGLEPRVLAELERFRTPGVSVAVVRDGQLLLARGYGLRRLEGALPMTAQTVQPIGSITKSFTVAVIASLVREGRMRWDQPVRELLPGFALASDELSARVTVRDLLTHRTGVARHDNAWFGSPFTREQLVLVDDNYLGRLTTTILAG